ncbi:Fibronectin type-III domain-containing protein [Trichostrongylus colubriformis]|uniref:Fibronectin type-III domain-containing protein n=1 Tax=Trichostrongylus colubriformis TaxID=6319 RepID=A0AAN8IND3_TRICO
MNGFGLSLQESQSGVKLSWPQSDVFMSRLRDIWNKVVGPNSQLQMRLFPADGLGKGSRLQGDPLAASPLVVGSLKKGTCYKVQIFTVTKSGIVSESRYNDYFRMSAPPVNISVHDVTRSSAVLHAAFISFEEVDQECVLNAVVLDMHSHVVLDKTLKAQSQNFTPIELNGLRPFHKYTVNSKITCSSGPSDCLPSTRTIRQLTFSTMQDKPGPVLSLSARPLNPYSAQLMWLPPALPNGILTHYVVDIKSEVLNFRMVNKLTIIHMITIYDTLTWMQVQRFDVWPLYAAAVDEINTRGSPSLSQVQKSYSYLLH